MLLDKESPARILQVKIAFSNDFIQFDFSIAFDLAIAFRSSSIVLKLTQLKIHIRLIIRKFSLFFFHQETVKIRCFIIISSYKP
jgi:hypothetical protein